MTQQNIIEVRTPLKHIEQDLEDKSIGKSSMKRIATKKDKSILDTLHLNENFEKSKTKIDISIGDVHYIKSIKKAIIDILDENLVVIIFNK